MDETTPVQASGFGPWLGELVFKIFVDDARNFIGRQFGPSMYVGRRMIARSSPAARARRERQAARLRAELAATVRRIGASLQATVSVPPMWARDP